MQKYDANNKPLPLCENSVIRDVSEVHTHPSFQCIHKKGCTLHSYNHNCLGVSCTSFTGYDISVLTLATPVTYSNKISPVCLPANPQSNKQYERKVAKIAGWGYYDISKKSLHKFLGILMCMYWVTKCAKFIGKTLKKEMQHMWLMWWGKDGTLENI